MCSLPRPELWAEPAKPGVLRFPPLRISMRINGVQSLVQAFRSRNKIIVWKIDKYRYIGYNYKKCAGMAELADALVLGASLRVRVRPPLPAPRRRGLCIVRDDFSFYKSSLACTVAPPFRKIHTCCGCSPAVTLTALPNFCGMQGSRVISKTAKISFIVLRHNRTPVWVRCVSKRVFFFCKNPCLQVFSHTA